jgi:metacaspase-1
VLAGVNARVPETMIRAVLVGIDQYERPDIPTLRGCVNDVALVRGLLKEYFAVPNERIRVVVNERATKANILHRLVDMIQRSEPGEVLVFYYSGHGSQIRDRDGDELADAIDEVICPYDMDWDSKTYIVDDDLDRIFATLPSDVLLEAFFDCCFWGAGPRGLGPDAPPLRRDVRYLPPPFDIDARRLGEEDALEVRRLQEGTWAAADRHVAWGASREGQEAAEDYVEGRANGVFTYWGCRFIAENIERVDRDGYTREELLDDVRAYLHTLGYVQTPELSAPSDLREGTPLLPTPQWGAWVEVGGNAQDRPRGGGGR